MGITIYGEDGQLETVNGGPFQFNAQGLNTGLSTNSKPFDQYRAGAATYLRMYEEQPWVKICVDKLTHQIARLPLKVYRGELQNKERVTTGALYEALKRPAPRKGPVALKQWLVKPALIHGAAALRIVRGRGGRLEGFRPLLWQYLDPRNVDGVPDGEIDFWRYQLPNAPPEILMPDEVLLVAWETVDGSVGTSPLKPLLDTLRIEYAARRYMHQLLRNGVRPPGGVSWSDNKELLPLVQDKEFRQQFEAELTRLMGGVENAGKPILMPPGATWHTFAVTGSDAEIIAHRKVGLIEVLASYDITPPNVGVLEDSSLAGLQALLPGLFQTTLPPWLTLVADSIFAQVIDPDPELRGQWVEHELGDVLRGDPVKEAVARKTDLMIGLRTINEVRGTMNLPRINHEDADRPMIPTNNMIFLGDSPARDSASEGQGANLPEVKALFANVQRAGDRAYRRLKAGEPADTAWDAGRFERELHEDLEAAGANGTSADTAKAWANALTVLVEDANGDPDALRTNFAALAPLDEPTDD